MAQPLKGAVSIGGGEVFSFFSLYRLFPMWKSEHQNTTLYCIALASLEPTYVDQVDLTGLRLG